LAKNPFPAKPSMTGRQQSIDSHAVPMLQQPGDEVGNKVAVPKGWFNWPDGGPRDPETLVMLTVTAWDPEGSKWDSRDEKKKSKKERNVKRFIVHPTVVSDDDDPRATLCACPHTLLSEMQCKSELQSELRFQRRCKG
jgi:hypothetical protein